MITSLITASGQFSFDVVFRDISRVGRRERVPAPLTSLLLRMPRWCCGAVLGCRPTRYSYGPCGGVESLHSFVSAMDEFP